ncbi:hypothetical protein LWI29_023338 [Acer saccharum]|uniref:Uncharacterized protein n=1 Tax=Acer saccharum TaxID=4024 RepID=A0AA39VRN8_ACESA|nr:hypothetical protein LWI29_023338 [Acer saccharum]
MPDTGHIIASRYNVVLLHISQQQCLTFLPLRSVPLPCTSRKVIAIGFVNESHFVEVFMYPAKADQMNPSFLLELLDSSPDFWKTSDCLCKQ